MVKLAAIAAASLAALIVLFLGVAYLAFEPSRDEVANVVSPDGEIFATLIEMNGGATTLFGYEVELKKRCAFFDGRPPSQHDLNPIASTIPGAVHTPSQKIPLNPSGIPVQSLGSISEIGASRSTKVG